MASLRQHGKGTSSTALAAGRRRVHTTFDDGVEMVEEYDAMTQQLMARKWKEPPSGFGREREWEYEIGSPPNDNNAHKKGLLFVVASNTPVFSCHDNTDSWEWRIRNLPYPKEVYQLSIEEKQDIVLRTTIKKYFKRFTIPSMIRNNLALEESELSMDYSGTTLTIQYSKPDAIIKNEELRRQAMQKRSSDKEGDVECKQQ